MKHILLGTGMALTLAACGGGGGGGGSTSSSSTVVPTAVISSSNQNYVAQDTASAAFTPLTGSQTITGAQVSDESALFVAVRKQIDQLPAYMQAAVANPVAAGAINSQTLACTGGGSLLVSANDADNSSSLTPGDVLSITANSCRDELGTLSGTVSFTFNALSGDLTTNYYTASMTLSYSAFTLTAPGYSSYANGSMTLAIDSNGAYTAGASVSAPSLTVSGSYGGSSRTRTLTNYVASYRRAPDTTYTSHTTYTFSGSVTSSAFGSQTISFETTTPFVVYGTQVYPTTGSLTITGASNTRLRLTALSNTQVQEELDADGNGTYESTTTVAWNTLL